VQYATEKKWDNLEIRIYEGSNGELTLYEDEGDNYNYEKGAYATIAFMWNDARKELTIGKRKGSFPEMLAERKFNIVRVAKGKGIGASATETFDHVVTYRGEPILVKL
jgi:alpha-D-xyloside xylohydrolase